jgi:hypothetical protein
MAIGHKPAELGARGCALGAGLLCLQFRAASAAGGARACGGERERGAQYLGAVSRARLGLSGGRRDDQPRADGAIALGGAGRRVARDGAERLGGKAGCAPNRLIALRFFGSAGKLQSFQLSGIAQIKIEAVV